MLAKMGIATIWDLLCHIPRRYEDRSHVRAICELRPGEPALVRGRILNAESVVTRRRGVRLTRALIRDDSGIAELVFFNQPFLGNRFQTIAQRRGTIYVYGIVRWGNGAYPVFEHPEWEEVEPAGDATSGGRIVPIYTLTAGLTQQWMRKMSAAAVEAAADLVPETLPDALRARYGLPRARDAFCSVHFPETLDEARAARRRLVFEEFLLLHLAHQARRDRWQSLASAPRIEVPADEAVHYVADLFPFQLTPSQEQAIREIAADMASGKPMCRLLHGDVGSGKTAVCVAAAVLAVRAGMQVAVMAPTEILALQHGQVFHRWLHRHGIAVDIAVGGRSARARSALLQRLASGATPVVVGTHALIEEDVAFNNLGLVVVDEQHRFGVLQRQALQDKGLSPHLLVMSATPIPRTLTLTLYGDLDVSCLTDMPPGRRPVKTYWKTPDRAEAVYKGVERLLAEGRQAYVVCPLVEASETTEAVAATEHVERIRRERLPGYRVGLLHGQMSSADKEAVMEAFRRHDIDVLVSTIVIEVGVDVPNAAVMVIEDADRFGLAQLHQLRGRVGRGSHPSYCVLIADPRSDEARRRMEIMTETTDGFRIAEEDLRLRGPGEFYGTKQSGMPTFRFGDLLSDESILIEARAAARAILSEDPQLRAPEHAGLRLAAEQAVERLEKVSVS